MSMCDVCLSPGACCRRMSLSGGNPVANIAGPMSRERAEHLALHHGLPFVPGEQKLDGTWYYSCTQLQKDGRCGIYEERPDLCRRYDAGSDPLCVHYWGDPADV